MASGSPLRRLDLGVLVGGDARLELGAEVADQALDRPGRRVAEGLGIDEPITAELYKLLVYDKGGFFVSHRDTEKAPGMFATQ